MGTCHLQRKPYICLGKLAIRSEIHMNSLGNNSFAVMCKGQRGLRQDPPPYPSKPRLSGALESVKKGLSHGTSLEARCPLERGHWLHTYIYMCKGPRAFGSPLPPPRLHPSKPGPFLGALGAVKKGPFAWIPLKHVIWSYVESSCVYFVAIFATPQTIYLEVILPSFGPS